MQRQEAAFVIQRVARALVGWRKAGGAVVTLLNWRGKPLPQLQLNVSGLGFTPSKVESVLHGALTPTSDGEGLTVSLPLESADFLLLHK